MALQKTGDVAQQNHPEEYAKVQSAYEKTHQQLYVAKTATQKAANDFSQATASGRDGQAIWWRPTMPLPPK